MDLIDLRLFKNISDTRSMTQGASRSHLSLPSASTRIKNLEDALGAKLFFRTNQGVVLTPVGEVFNRYSRNILLQMDELKGALNDYLTGASNSVRVCASKTASREFLPFTLRRFLDSNSDAQVELVERSTPDVIQAVRDGNADIGIYTKAKDTGGLATIPYRTDRFVLAVSPSHPLAAKASLAFEETLDYEYVGVREFFAGYGFLMDTAAKMNKQLRMRVHVNGFDAVIRLIEGNIGIGILPNEFAQQFANSLRLIQLTDAWALRQWYICMRNRGSLSPSASHLVDLLVEDGKALSA